MEINKLKRSFVAFAWLSRTALVVGGSFLVGALAMGGPAAAVELENPDWPCVQRKVLVLTPAVLWDGPAVAKDAAWRNSGEILNLTAVFMARRVPLEDIEKAIAEFAKSKPEDKRDEQLTLLFAGLLDRTNSRRTQIIKGIEEIERRQRARAKEIERQGVALAALEDRFDAGEKELKDKIAEAKKAYDWDARVFKERQENIPLACEIPVLIEQRAYGLSRTIRNHMSE